MEGVPGKRVRPPSLLHTIIHQTTTLYRSLLRSHLERSEGDHAVCWCAPQHTPHLPSFMLILLYGR